MRRDDVHRHARVREPPSDKLLAQLHQELERIAADLRACVHKTAARQLAAIERSLDG